MAKLNWRTTWEPVEMVKAISTERTFGLAGVTVSKTTLMWVMELTPELRTLLVRNGYRPRQEQKYMVYWEHAGVEAETSAEYGCQPFLWEIRFDWLNLAAKSASRVWWTEYTETPSTAADCLPDGVSVSDVFVLQA